MIGALAYGLGSFNIISIEAGHMWKVWAMAYMPMVLAGVHLTFRRKYLLGMAVTASGIGIGVEIQPPANNLLSAAAVTGLWSGSFSLCRQGRTVKTTVQKPGVFDSGGYYRAVLQFGKNLVSI